MSTGIYPFYTQRNRSRHLLSRCAGTAARSTEGAFPRRISAFAFVSTIAALALALLAAFPAGATQTVRVLPVATRILLPTNATSNANSSLEGVSCPSPGSCTAVGFFEDSSKRDEAMAVTERNGAWGRPVEVPAPANSSAFLKRISCSSAGNCKAVGFYITTSGQNLAMVATESNGIWSRARGISAPTNAGLNPVASLVSISCPGAMNCSAVGAYADKFGRNQVMLATYANGVWNRAVEMSVPTNAGRDPNPSISDVSCHDAGNCTAVGTYVDRSNHNQAMFVTKTGGNWAGAREELAPKNAGANPSASLFGVSCSSAKSCTVVGEYADTASHIQALFGTQANGNWSQAKEITAPTNSAKNPNDPYDSVRCSSSNRCVAVGYFLDGSKHQIAMITQERNADWPSGSKVLAPPDAGVNPHAFFDDLSCPKGGTCTAVGEYEDRSSIEHAMSVSVFRS